MPAHLGYDVIPQNHDFWPEKAVERAQRNIRNTRPIVVGRAEAEQLICGILGLPYITEGAVMPLRDGTTAGPLRYVPERRTWTDDARSDEWKANGKSTLYPGSGDIVRVEPDTPRFLEAAE